MYSCQTCYCEESSCANCTVLEECLNPLVCCCSAAHQAWKRITVKKGILLEYITLTWLSIEIIGSLWAGLAAGSIALLAFGGDSLVEFISGSVVLYHLRKDYKNLDAKTEHAEKIASMLLFLLIPIIGIGTVYSYLIGLRPEHSLLGIVIAVGAVIIMPYLWLEKRRIGTDAKCLPLSIDATESAVCFFMSVALLVGLLAEYFLGLWQADYIATGVILIFIAKEAIEHKHELGLK